MEGDFVNPDDGEGADELVGLPVVVILGAFEIDGDLEGYCDC